MAVKLKSSDFTRNLVKNHKLAGHIDGAIGKGEFEWSATFGAKGGDDAWHPSGDCLPEPLALYNKAMGIGDTRSIPTSLRKTFQVGHFWHAYIQHVVVEHLGFATWDDIEVKGETRWGKKPYQWATGAADIAPCSIPGSGDWLIDIKTMGSFDYKQMGLPTWCAPKYEAQVNIYMDWFDLDRTIILCVSKDSPHEFKEFVFERNQPLIDAVYQKWEVVGACVAAGVPPTEEYTIELPFLGPKL